MFSYTLRVWSPIFLPILFDLLKFLALKLAFEMVCPVSLLLSWALNHKGKGGEMNYYYYGEGFFLLFSLCSSLEDSSVHNRATLVVITLLDKLN